MASTVTRSERNRLLALITLFASIHGCSAAVPGLWGPSEVARSFVIFVEAIEGIVLGPLAGFASGFMGMILGRIIRPREEGFLLSVAFGMGEPMAALVAGLMFKRRWPFIALAFTSMLALILIDPLTWEARLPLWSLWDIFLALLMILPTHFAVRRALAHRGYARSLSVAIGMTTFVSTEADVLFRICLLVPLKLYLVYPIPVEALPAVFMMGALVTPIEAALSVIFTVLVAVPVLRTIEGAKVIRWPVT